jgi:hypothetical protein
MKNRYFGDLYDYIKYSLIRQLIDPMGSRAVICWMLTEDGVGKDGQRTNYLREPGRWSSFEPDVFDFLRHQLLDRGTRNIRAIEKSNLLDNFRFFSTILTDDGSQRDRYFEQFIGFARGAQFVFFDPDNGVEVESVKYGRKNSSKYLYWNEIERALRANHTLLIYQHLPPKPRRPLIRHVTGRLLKASQSGIVHTIRTRRVAFFLVPRRGSVTQLRSRLTGAERKWKGILTVSEHRINEREPD